MPRITVESRLEALRKKFAADYDLSSLNSSNDKSNLEQLLRFTIANEDLANELNNLIGGGASANVQDIVKISGAIDTLSTKCLALEKQLGIDRKTRRAENDVESVAEYIKELKLQSRDFLEQRLTKVYCPDCKVMVMRFAPVHEHTKFSVECECSQCGKMVRAKRDSKDVLFDIAPKDRAWRQKHPVVIEHPKKNASDEVDSEDDELTIGGGGEE